MDKSNDVIKVLQVTGAMNRGGAETMIMNLYRELDKTKTQFDFVSYSQDKGDYDDEINKMGGRIIRISSPKKSGFFRYLISMKDINKLYGPYDVIHSHTLFNSGIVLLCSKLIGIPVRISHAHSTSDSGKKGFKYSIYKTIMKMIINISSTKKVACGEEAGKYLYGQNFIKDGWIMPNAINIDNFTSINQEDVFQCKDKISSNNQEIVIGNVGSFREVKNHKFMLEIAKEMKNKNILFKMIFVGNGPLIENIKAEVASNGLGNHIIFAGLRDDVPLLMRVFDVLFMPSLYEGFPVTLVESQSSRIVAVISENISNEVDFNLGLITRLSLSANKELWIKALMKAASFKGKVSQEEVFKRLSDRGYTTKSSINTLMEIYDIIN